MVVCIGSELQLSISSVSICYGKQSDIRVKSYCHLNLLTASVFNYDRQDILRDSFRHPSKKLLSFEFAMSFWVKSVLIYYETQLDIRVKIYCCLILLRASVLNFQRLDILRDTIGHPTKMLLSFEFRAS